MSVFQDKFWSTYPSWFEREAPLRRALINAFAGTLESLRVVLQRLVRQRFYSSAEWSVATPAYLEQQLRGPWRILHIDRSVAPLVYTLYRASSGDVGLSYKSSTGQVVLLPRAVYDGPGLYQLASKDAPDSVWVLMGQVGVGATEPFKIVSVRTPDYLKAAIEDSGWRTTQPTNPADAPRTWADIRSRARHFFSRPRGGRTAIRQALRFVDSAATVESFREDWTSRIYGGFSFIDHFWKKTNPQVVPDRSYWTTIWKAQSSEVCRIIARISPQMVNSQEIGIILDQYIGDGIIAEVKLPLAQIGPPPPPPTNLPRAEYLPPSLIYSSGTISALSNGSYSDSASGFPVIWPGEIISVFGFGNGENNGEKTALSRTLDSIAVVNDPNIFQESCYKITSSNIRVESTRYVLSVGNFPEGWVVGQSIIISGFLNEENNGIKTISSLSSDITRVSEDLILIDEPEGNQIEMTAPYVTIQVLRP